MKRCLLIVLLLFVSLSSYGQGWEWATGTRGSNNYGRFSAVDTLSNIFVTGETFGASNFISDTITNLGYIRVYLSKFDSSGKLKWVKGSTGRNTAGAVGSGGVATDIYGNVYLLGFYDSVIAFDGNVLTNPYIGAYPTSKFPWQVYMFLAKFDSSGNNQWVKKIGDFMNVAGSTNNNGITIDCDGNIYLICSFLKDAHIGSYSFANKDTSGTTSDMIVAKLDSSGSTMWAKQFGGDKMDFASNIALTPSNDICLTGSFHRDTLTIGTDILIDTCTSTGFYQTATFMAKLDNSGNPLWAKSDKNGSWLCLNDMIVNSNSEIFALGCYNQELSLGSYALPSANGSVTSYGYLAKYDISGNLLWAKTMKGQYIFSESLTLDGCGNVWVLGHFGIGTVTTSDTLDGNIISPPVKNVYPLFIAGWSSTGTYIGSSVLPSGGRVNYTISTLIDKTNKLYIIGNNTLDTLKIASDTLYGSTSATNMFLAKYDPNLICAPYYRYYSLFCDDLGQPIINLNSTEIKVYPNPANTECTITYNGILSTHASIAIYDLTGRLMHIYPLTGSSTTISIAHLPPGMYVCKIDADGNGAVSRKLVVMR